jgi:hypothetical protein
VDLPSYKVVIFHSYVSLPMGIPRMMFVNLYARIRPSLWSTSGAALAPTLEIFFFRCADWLMSTLD